MRVEIKPTADMRPEWGVGFAILGYDEEARLFGHHCLKVTPSDGEPVFTAIHVAEPGTPSPA